MLIHHVLARVFFWKTSLKTLIQGWLSCFFQRQVFPHFCWLLQGIPLLDIGTISASAYHVDKKTVDRMLSFWNRFLCISWTGCTTPFVRSFYSFLWNSANVLIWTLASLNLHARSTTTFALQNLCFGKKSTKQLRCVLAKCIYWIYWHE